MSNDCTARLPSYLDGQLSPLERAEVERHLAHCGRCRETLSRFEALERVVASQADRPPERDLWPAIAAALEPQRSTPGRLWTWAAALAALMLSGGATWWILLQPLRAPVADPRIEAYLAVSDELRARLDAVEIIDSTLAERLREDLAAFDRAVEQTQRALRQTPGDRFLEEHLARTLRSRVRYLQRADRLVGFEDEGDGS